VAVAVAVAVGLAAGDGAHPNRAAAVTPSASRTDAGRRRGITRAG